ncbi:hypothetical protein PHYSODRAFT_328534 [Phytophthora sojae]|uniref:Uncharacterized protein n=1 Tax=Phytophthora sojae (strain P6497) TaxID=1094619 RepID=G4Z880_PHYSP|nr:hypothetical protein PHYSODRAFT_328534 [Phytophthora sojae]EGZ20432.1 hypothetical protein PHYSODRAFT_328534 [Phytophthora sojae]|eukprot:XP_009523149.1 hypothetical protein PHYSODRAFT_328534 [Phytophthora sojae]
MDTDPMEAESLPAPPATTPPARDLNAHIAEDEEEMPLLFMDELPSNFQQNAQLAAIATFMADSDDDAAAEDDEEDASRAGDGGKQRRQRQQKSARSRRRQEPYAKPLAKGKEPKSKKNRDTSKAADTKELQLFLSMFHVSKAG